MQLFVYRNFLYISLSTLFLNFFEKRWKTMFNRFVFLFSKPKTNQQVSGSSFWFENEIVGVVLSNHFRRRNETKQHQKIKTFPTLGTRHFSRKKHLSRLIEHAIQYKKVELNTSLNFHLSQKFMGGQLCLFNALGSAFQRFLESG